MNNSTLLNLLAGCLDSNKVKQSEQQLAQYSESGQFLQELLLLIPNQEPNMLIMVLSTLKNYILAKWNPAPPTTPIPEDQKQLLKENIFNLFYQIQSNEQAVNLYKEIQETLVLVCYPWPGVFEQLNQDLDSNIFASVHFARQLTKAFEYSTFNDEISKLEDFACRYLPKMESLVEQSLTNFNPDTSRLITIILKMFFSIIHTHHLDYLKNHDNFSRWVVYVKTILQASLPNNETNERVAAKIMSRILNQYMNSSLENKHLKGWNDALRERHGSEVVATIFHCLSNPNGDEETAAEVLNGVIALAANHGLRGFLDEEKVRYILYDRLLPNLELSPQDENLFGSDPFEFIRKDEDISSYIFKRNAEDAIEYILQYCNFGEKSELMKFIEYSANALQSDTVSVRHKEVLVKQITKMSSKLKKNNFIRGNFEHLTNMYFVPLLKADNPLLNSVVCRLFAAYLDDMQLSEGTVGELMGLIYEKMIGKSLVLNYNAILAFTSLLSHPSALKSSKEHFSNILQIYVKMLDEFEHENLLKCLESIVNVFSNQITTFAPSLIEHMLNKFKSSYDNTEGDQDEEDGNKQACAALSTIEQILQCPLTEDVYFKASQQIIPLVEEIFGELEEYFGEVLSLVNVLVYRANSILNPELLYVICRKVLEGRKSQVDLSVLGQGLAERVIKSCETSSTEASDDLDSEFEANVISILKNLIQKLPIDSLLKQPYPSHPELILCLIENKKIPPEHIQTKLDTSKVNQIWVDYLVSYTYLCYNQGRMSEPRALRLITGVSLYPWIKECFGLEVVKLILGQIQSEEDDENDDLDDENTMQMLEKYGHQEDCEEYDVFHDNHGINYAFFYDSPFDSSKDKQMLISTLKSLSNSDANALMNSLNSRDRVRLEALFK